ncbi:MAG: nucleotidyltransferase family protein [Burkholderiaceae bacterium]|nr:nucleotidyltransferase family protein [Roseateles sp.]MBV8470118.1 nucleotidyltransferase family protein [Burkholderiaceae bacterium]
MKALILAAGRGERMRPLTDHTPKPLLEVAGKPLIVWHIEALARAGVQDIVINTAWLGEQLPQRLGSGERYGARLSYSHEAQAFGGALETAGGVAQVRDWLAAPDSQGRTDPAFWLVSGDTFLPGFHFDPQEAARFSTSDLQALLWLVPNAPHHPQGDFGIDAQGLAQSGAEVSPRYTWASVGLFKHAMFGGIAPGTRMPLRPLLEQGIAARRIGAQLYTGMWIDVGTPERFEQAKASVQA